MSAELFTNLSRATDINADPLSGATWTFYATGTTTPLAAYTTSDLDVEHSNPVVADSGGDFASIYFNGTVQYRAILRDADGSTIEDIDPANPAAFAGFSGNGGLGQIGSTGGQNGQEAVNRVGLHVGKFGVVGTAPGDTGVDESTGIATAIAAAEAAGVTLNFDGSRVYTNNTDHEITTSGVAIDGHGCLMLGSGRFAWNGDSGIDGDRSSALFNVGIKNMRFGDTHRGPLIFWCSAIEVDNIERVAGNTSGTFLNVHYCEGGSVRNVVINDSEETKIGVLGLHSSFIHYDGIQLLGGAYVYGVQIKGGAHNLVENGLIRGCTVQHGWRIRGDAPFQASTTTGTYPYATGAWTDTTAPLRATRFCTFRNLRVESTTNIPTKIAVHFLAQEFRDCTIENCHTDGTGLAGFAIIMGSADGERNIRVINSSAISSGLTSSYGLNITGLSSTELLEGVEIRGFRADGYTSAVAVTVTYCAAPRIIAPVLNDNTSTAALYLVDSPDALVDRASGDGNIIGILAAHAYSLYDIEIREPNFTNSSTRNISCTVPSHITTRNGGRSSTLTGNGTENVLVRFTVPTDTTATVFTRMLQKDESTGNVRATERRATAKNASGVLSWVGTSGGTAPYDEDGTSAGVATTLTISGTDIRLNLGSTLGGSVVSTHKVLETRMEVIS